MKLKKNNEDYMGAYVKRQGKGKYCNHNIKKIRNNFLKWICYRTT